MKIDKKNVRHWLYLLLSAFYMLIAVALRPLRRKRGGIRVLLYGHKLNGNLLAIYRRLQSDTKHRIEVAFLTLDPAYHAELMARGESSVLATSARCVSWLATTNAIVSDHGLHALSPMTFLSDIKFFDVWHGIPFKGFDAEDFRIQHRFHETWVTSPLMAQLYVEKFGFRPEQVQVTGYARTDRLVERLEDPIAIKQALGIDPVRRCILFAPTWKQDASNRRLYPFGVAETAFLRSMSELCGRYGTTLLLRKHINSGGGAGAQMEHVVDLPYAVYPDTEQILLISDILVCDWSSIAFDYLLLDRPTIFLDVEAPFAKGFSLASSFRFGAIVPGMPDLLAKLTQYLSDPDAYGREFSARHAEIRSLVYGAYGDGRATERCVGRVKRGLTMAESSR